VPCLVCGSLFLIAAAFCDAEPSRPCWQALSRLKRFKSSLPCVQLLGVQAVLAAVFRALSIIQEGRLNDGDQLGFGIPVIRA